MQHQNTLSIHIYVQHLLGSGHLVRMRTLAARLGTDGQRVKLLCGGVSQGQPPHHAGLYEWVQLPAVKTAPGDFSVLLDADGHRVSDQFKARRRDALLRAVGDDLPDVLVVETFPFGRRGLRFELEPLLEMVSARSPRPLRICSIRDILQRRRPKRDSEAVAAVEKWFDYVLVHADPRVVTLGESFPLARELGDKVFYSNYLYEDYSRTGEPPRAQNHDRWDEVVVSAGGGAVGWQLLQVALAARAKSALRRRTWRLLVGHNLPNDAFEKLRAQAPAGVVVERNRSDFVALLRQCAVSVSQSGYNSVLDSVAAGCRSVLVPYQGDGETEQLQRAEKFAALGCALLLPESRLSPQTLAQSVDAAAQLKPPNTRIALDGAQRSCDFIINAPRTRYETPLEKRHELGLA